MHAAPGWYPDPEAPHLQRWWDGSAWSEHRLDRPSQAPPAAAGAAAPPHAVAAQIAVQRQADAIMSAARKRPRAGSFGDNPREALKFFAVVGLLTLIGAGFGISRFESTWGSVDIGLSPAPAAATTVAADPGCIASWNATSGPVGAQRRLLGSNRDALLVHVSRVSLDLPGALVAGGSCGVVVADRQGNTLHAFSNGTGGAAGRFVDIANHRAAQFLGRVGGASDVNAALHPDGTLQAITPAAG